MSSDESSNAPSERRDAVREKALQVQAQQKRTHRIRTATIAASIVAVVAITAVGVTWAVSSAASKPMLEPANATDDGFVVTVAGATEAQEIPATPTPTPTADPEASPTPTAQPSVDIRVYVDYLSAGSGEFQVANSTQLSKWVTEGAATLTYYPVAMLTAKSNGTKYSLRAASAAACVGTHAPDAFWAFNDAVLAKQPDVDSDGYSDTELADIAQAAGATSPKVVRACIEDEDFATWAKGATERALKSIPDTDDVVLTGAPMVLVNGMPYVGALDDPKEFAQFVLTIASDAYYKEASASPTPTATP
ncbi:DsbA family protein [Microbacterium sp.]|uniref:DsbA family protein n=1 Tax=Microbacterium sp. TaxID=51671 RepID=UPI003F6EEF52